MVVEKMTELELFTERADEKETCKQQFQEIQLEKRKKRVERWITIYLYYYRNLSTVAVGKERNKQMLSKR